jgi:hypothetical protein
MNKIIASVDGLHIHDNFIEYKSNFIVIAFRLKIYFFPKKINVPLKQSDI